LEIHLNKMMKVVADPWRSQKKYLGGNFSILGKSELIDS